MIRDMCMYMTRREAASKSGAKHSPPSFRLGGPSGKSMGTNEPMVFFGAKT